MEDVVRRAQGGEVAAFEIVYRTQAAAVHALCRRMCHDDREATEIVQDVFVRAWERLGTFRGESALSTWLHRLAVNVVLERGRIAKRDAARWIEDPTGPAVHSEARTRDLDAGMDIDAATERLPAGARIVFVLHDMYGFSHEEIARMTGIAAGTSRTQLFRARRSLARLLDL